MKSNLLLSLVVVFLVCFGSNLLAQSPGQVCSDPIALECNGEVIVGSTLGVPSDNATSGYGVCSSMSSSNGQIWYALNTPEGNQITISTCDPISSFDTFLSVYSGECGALSCVAFNDDACNLRSIVSFIAEAGETYLVRVGGFGSQSGTYGLSVNCLAILAGCTDPNASNYNAEATSDDGSCLYEGCTDVNAINFNPGANTDDGSCEYCNGPGSVNALMYVCAFANGGEIAIDIVDSQGNIIATVSGLNNNAIAYYTLCLVPGECYTAQLSNSAGNTGWYNGYFWINTNGEQLINESLNVNLTSENVVFSLDGTCTNVSGCTDPEAGNYNPDANSDDGSCTYPLVCEEGTTNVNLNCTGGTFPGEVSFTIADENGNIVYVSPPLYGLQFLIEDLCLPDGCYTIMMYDSWGDGWNGAVLTVTFGGTMSTYTLDTFTSIGAGAFGINSEGCVPDFLGGCTDPNAENYNAEADYNDNSCIYSGCTDPAAINYSYYATIDDGSCEYCDGPGSINSTLYICTFSSGGQVEFQINDDQGNEVIYVSGLSDGQIFTTSLCLQPGVCYTAYMSNNAGPFGWYGGYFWVNSNGIQIVTGQPGSTEQVATMQFSIDGTCGEVYGCTDPAASNYDPAATADNGYCWYDVYGCTDPNAMNYNGWATIDDGSCVYVQDCEANLVVFNVVGGQFPNEISFSVVDENGNVVAGGYGAGLFYGCFTDGCYVLNMYDSFGDGWDGGGYMEVTTNGLYVGSFSLAFGLFEGTAIFGINSNDCIPVISGCTDPAALNYNPYANEDDGSCIYAEDCTDNLITVYIATQLWGSEVSWSLVNSDGVEVASGNGYSSWNTYTEYVCLPDGCYSMVMNDSWGDGWNGAYYMIYGNGTYAEGSLLYGDNTTDLVGVNAACGDVAGCIDPAALNYNPAATMDDGSCIYNDNGGNDGFIGLDIDFTIYPNPANTGMVVDINNLSKTDAIQISVLSVDGKLVMGETIMNNSQYRRHSMDVSSLESGYYLLMVRNGSAQKVLSFIKE
ncbi:MAG: T9SS type A sorting domain-containing protein [Flavobacteriales bacterium]